MKIYIGGHGAIGGKGSQVNKVRFNERLGNKMIQLFLENYARIPDNEAEASGREYEHDRCIKAH